ncbi:MAG: hypothetical protein KDJ63_06745, partial [Nitratireductor sp.]|nr:hypothetical protein [Nitratireductor sp.]
TQARYCFGHFFFPAKSLPFPRAKLAGQPQLCRAAGNCGGPASFIDSIPVNKEARSSRSAFPH